MDQRQERIDGTDYTVGSAEHGAARRARQSRLDAQYIEAHKAEIDLTAAQLRHSTIGQRFDANQSAFIARDLLFVRREIEATIYEKLRAAEFVPVDSSIPRGAQTYATRRTDLVGEAKISHTLAGDHPRADVSVTEDQLKLVNVTASYAYDLQDLEYAAFSGVPLPRWKAMAAAEVIARGLDRVGRIGDATAGLTGFFNNTFVDIVTLTNGAWLTATADDIVEDLAQIEQTMIAQSRDSYAPDVLILPTSFEGRLATLQRSSGSDMSVKTWFLANARIIKSIERWVALDDAISPDVTVADPPAGILYAKRPDVLFWPIPIMYEEQPPEERGFEWTVHCRARCGGVDVRRPVSMLYVENLD